MMKKVLKVLLGILAVLAIAYIVTFNLPKASSKNKKAELSVSATDLYKSFEDNESEANALYNNKIIEVKGRIINISEDRQGALVILLDSGSQMGTVLCTLEHKPDVLPSVNSTVTVKGQCNGFLTDVILNKCRLQKSQ